MCGAEPSPKKQLNVWNVLRKLDLMASSTILYYGKTKDVIVFKKHNKNTFGKYGTLLYQKCDVATIVFNHFLAKQGCFSRYFVVFYLSENVSKLSDEEFVENNNLSIVTPKMW